MAETRSIREQLPSDVPRTRRLPLGWIRSTRTSTRLRRLSLHRYDRLPPECEIPALALRVRTPVLSSYEKPR